MSEFSVWCRGIAWMNFALAMVVTAMCLFGDAEAKAVLRPLQHNLEAASGLWKVIA